MLVLVLLALVVLAIVVLADRAGPVRQPPTLRCARSSTSESCHPCGAQLRGLVRLARARVALAHARVADRGAIAQSAG